MIRTALGAIGTSGNMTLLLLHRMWLVCNSYRYIKSSFSKFVMDYGVQWAGRFMFIDQDNVNELYSMNFSS